VEKKGFVWLGGGLGSSQQQVNNFLQVRDIKSTVLADLLGYYQFRKVETHRTALARFQFIVYHSSYYRRKKNIKLPNPPRPDETQQYAKNIGM
jgi:hypothetical protein